jgi:hypothetical protein
MALSILDGNQSPATLSTIVTGGQHISAHTVVSLGTQAITDMRSAVSGSVISVGNSVIIQVVNAIQDGEGTTFGVDRDFPITGAVAISAAIPAGTNRIGVVTIGGGSVTLGAGTAQIGSVTASISNSVVTFYPMQGTSVSSTNFTSTTASTTLVSAVAGREVLTVFNEGAGNLHISPGATCTTIAYQVRLSAGDYWECPAGQLSLAHTAVFATAGTARVTQVS